MCKNQWKVESCLQMQVLLLLAEHDFVIMSTFYTVFSWRNGLGYSNYSSKSGFEWNPGRHYFHISCFHSPSVDIFLISEWIHTMLKWNIWLSPPRSLSPVVCNTADWTRNARNNSLLLSVQPFQLRPTNWNISTESVLMFFFLLSLIQLVVKQMKI